MDHSVGVGDNLPTGVCHISLRLGLVRTLGRFFVVEGLGWRVKRAALGIGLSPCRRSPPLRTSDILQICIASGCIILGIRFIILGDLPTRLVLRVIFLQLSRAQQRVDLAMPKYPDLLIREGSLHAVGIVAQVILCIVDMIIFLCRFCYRRD